MRTRSALPVAMAALVGPSVAVGSSAQAQAEAPNEPERYCSTRVLTEAELDAGAKSVITCSTSAESALGLQGYEVPAGLTPEAALSGGVVSYDGTGLVAIHYDGNGATGSSLSVIGTVCDGGGISFSAGDWWNDRISSTRHQACSTIKHWVNSDFSGTAEVTQQPSGWWQTLNATNNQVSSIKYFGPNN